MTAPSRAAATTAFGASLAAGSRRLLPVAEKRGPSGRSACTPAIARREGDGLVVDGRSFAFFGVNTTFLVHSSYPADRVEGVVADLAAKGVNTLRIWFFADDDPERLQAALDLGARYGIRYVVVLGDNVNKGRDWLFSDDDKNRYRPHVLRTVERFAARPEVLLWEPLNEPNCGDRYDTDCLETIRDWLTVVSQQVVAVDPCHLVSSGMIGAGNYDADREAYRRIHEREAIGILSMHRRSTDKDTVERDIAAELDKPLFAGEVYDAAYDDGCGLLDGRSTLSRRAERVKDDLRDWLQHGLDGYLLWDYDPGAVKTDGDTRYYCGPYSFESSDPLWALLAESQTVPPVPWK